MRNDRYDFTAIESKWQKIWEDNQCFAATDDYSKTEKVADVEYTVDGRYMTVKIPKAGLGISGDEFTVNFSWTDNVHDEGDYTKFSGDILDFYLSGDVAPGGRFKYSYISTNANTTGEEETTATETQPAEPSTTPETKPETNAPADTAAPDTTPTEGDTEPTKGGCKSSVAAGAAAVVMAAAAAVVLKKKED